MSVSRRILRKAADNLHEKGLLSSTAVDSWRLDWEDTPLLHIGTPTLEQSPHPYQIPGIPEARLVLYTLQKTQAHDQAGNRVATMLSVLSQQMSAQQSLAAELLNQYRENALLLKAAARMAASPEPLGVAEGLLACVPPYAAAAILKKSSIILATGITLSLEDRQALATLALQSENGTADLPPAPWQQWSGLLWQALPPSSSLLVLWRKAEQPRFTSVDTNTVALLAHLAGPLLSHAEQRDATQRLQSTLNRYLPAGVAEKLLRENRVNLGGDEYHAAVLFADIRHFTQMTRTLGARMVVDTLNQLYTELVTVIQTHGGIVDKFMGDGIMAVFGVPLALDEPEQHAIKAAGAILKASRALGIDISIGISAGTVIAGNIGSPQRMDYTVIGDAVNIAAKLQKLVPAPAPSLLITEPCYARLREPEAFQPLLTLSILDNTPPVKIYAPSS